MRQAKDTRVSPERGHAGGTGLVAGRTCTAATRERRLLQAGEA